MTNTKTARGKFIAYKLAVGYIGGFVGTLLGASLFFIH